MKNNWTLTVKTSLPNVCVDDADLTTSITSFENFEAARDAMREVIKSLAFSDNAMFDGNGHLKNLALYIEEALEVEAEYDDAESDDSDWLTSAVLQRLDKYLESAFLGETVKLDFTHNKYEDCYVTAKITKNSLNMRGYGEGPMNGVNPRIRTNIFDMSKEKTIYCTLMICLEATGVKNIVLSFT